MKKPVIVIAALAALVVAGAVVFRLASSSSSDTVADAGSAIDAGEAVDAGSDAGTGLLDAGSAVAPRQWTLNPRVSSSSGDSFATLQEAIDATGTGQTITVPTGVYVITSPLRIVEKLQVKLIAPDGPAYLRVLDLPEGEPAIAIAQSSAITLEGFVIESAGSSTPPAIIRATDTQTLTIRRSELSGGEHCIHLERSGQVVLENLSVGPCGAAAIHVLDGRGSFLLSKSRVFASGLGLGLFQSDGQDGPSDVRVASSTVTSGIGFGGFKGQVVLSASILSTRVRAAVDAVKPYFGESPLLVLETLGTPSDELRAQWAATLAAAKSVYVVVDPAPTAEQLGYAPGTDFSWTLKGDERGAAAAVAAQLTPDVPEATVEEGPLVVADGPVPLCGVGEKLKVFPGPEVDSSPPTREIETCEQLGGDIGTVPEMFTIDGPSKTWVRIVGGDGFSGYVMAKDLHAAEEIQTTTARILMPGYKCERGFSKAKDSILVRCASDACSGETCSYEEDGKLTTSGNPTVMRNDHEITLPEGATVKKTDAVTRNFSALCCT